MPIEVLAGVALAWLWRKLQRVGGRLDEDLDEVTDRALDRLTTAVKGKLSGDPALARLESQAAAGEEVTSTQERVKLSIVDAAKDDPAFAEQLRTLVDQVQAGTQQGQRVAGRDYYEVSGSNATFTVNNRT